MTIDEVHAMNQKVDKAIAALVREAIEEFGVPRTAADITALAAVLHPQINALRRGLYRESVLEMGRTVSAMGYEVAPAQERLYPMSAVESFIGQAVGLGVGKNTVPVEILDPVSKQMATVRIAPYLVDDPSDKVLDVVRARITATASRHVRAVARQMVADTVEFGEARHKATKRPAMLGYARVLSGAENCGFCAMLASRGAVYKKDTALYRRDGRRYHDNCDCVARLVIEGEDWEGRQESEALYQLYAKSTEVDDDGRVDLRGFYKAWANEDDHTSFSPLSRAQSAKSAA